MKTVTSKDGTTIAFDQSGSGHAVILVPGAFSYRAYPGQVQLAGLLAQRFTVINYDRRGRGDSRDTAPYAIGREVEDLEALIAEVGGSAYVWGFSSGAALALYAAAGGLNITKLVLHDAPFVVDDVGHRPPKDYVNHLTELIAADRRSDAARYVLTKGFGAPAIAVTAMRFMPGVWSKLTAVANTLPYDAIILDGYLAGDPLPAGPWASVTAPTLVLDGEKSPVFMRHAAQALAETLPNAERRTLAGQNHTNPSWKAIAPVLTEFFAQPIPARSGKGSAW
jgi:pimeloyl-ACP methyl ester carboxylesterase